VVLAEQTFPGLDFRSKVFPVAGITLDQYMAKLDCIIMPMDLMSVTDCGKCRPDEVFRQSEIATFASIDYPNVVRLPAGHLGERCKSVVDIVLSHIGRSDVFRDWYLIEEVGRTAAELLQYAGVQVSSIYVSGTMSRKSPTLPAHNSDMDLFVTGTLSGTPLDISYVACHGAVAPVLDTVSNYLFYLFGMEFHILPISERLASVIKPLEPIWEC
jgi:hypothetical protein